MSLRAFHLLFIGLSIVLAAFLAAWAAGQYRIEVDIPDLRAELAQPPDSYRNDHSKMVVQLEQPCRARYEVRV